MSSVNAWRLALLQSTTSTSQTKKRHDKEKAQSVVVRTLDFETSHGNPQGWDILVNGSRGCFHTFQQHVTHYRSVSRIRAHGELHYVFSVKRLSVFGLACAASTAKSCSLRIASIPFLLLACKSCTDSLSFYLSRVVAWKPLTYQ